MLIGFVRHVHEFKIVENIFCLCSLQSRTTAEEIFRAIDEVMRKFHLDWKNLISLCTDGAPAMIGVRSGLAIKVAEVANENFEAIHCILHREALASESMSKELSETWHPAVKMINFIKASALNIRIFSLLCDEIDSEYRTLLLHTKVRWLSRGKSFNRLVTFLLNVTNKLASQIAIQIFRVGYRPCAICSYSTQTSSRARSANITKTKTRGMKSHRYLFHPYLLNVIT